MSRVYYSWSAGLILILLLFCSNDICGKNRDLIQLQKPSKAEYDILKNRHLIKHAKQRRLDPSDIKQNFDVESPLSLKYGKILLNDMTYVLGAPLRWEKNDWRSFIIKSLIVKNTMTFLDLSARDIAEDNRNKFTNGIGNTFNRFGSGYSTNVRTAFFIHGYLFGNKTSKMVALDMLSATFITNAIITPGLKNLFGRTRPYREMGEDDFHPFSGNESFPSGHAIRAFVNASVIASHYKQTWVKVLAYSIASLVAYARMNRDVHFLSDVVAGAFIGIAIGQGTVKLNKKLRSGLN
ncbi:MAG: phosphatase PAP2 family protein [Candidatus Zixiibacteriota bacterium]